MSGMHYKEVGLRRSSMHYKEVGLRTSGIR